MNLLSSKSFFFLFLLFLCNTISFTQEDGNNLLDEYLIQYLKIKNVPSISAGILEKDSITWLKAVGKSDIENNVPASKNSLYRIASISKPITAVAILQLWERGLLNLDADVRKYIPEFPEKKYKFTIRQLLNHTSGIRNYKEGEFDSKKFFPTTNDALKLLAFDSLLFEPGTRYAYTTLGYTLLASIVEKVSNTSFEEYLKANIFLPAGMQSTFVDKQREIIFNRAKGYEKDAKRKIVNAPLADLSIKVAGGGLLSTSKDLLLFAKALLGNILLKQSTLDMMLSESKLKNGKLLDYGLGFSLAVEEDSLKYFFHNGAGTGFMSMLLVDPKRKIASVHLINMRDRNLGEPARDILEMSKSDTLIMPSKTLSDELMNVYAYAGIDSTIKTLNNIYSEYQSLYTLNENEAIFFAQDLVELKKIPDTISYLKEVLKYYPKSSIVLVTLADVYYLDKNNGLALRYYRSAAQIDPSNQRVKNQIKRLSSK